MRVAGRVYPADRQHDVLRGVGVARRHGLQRHDQVAGDHHRVSRLVGFRGMPALPFDHQPKLIHRRIKRARADVEFAQRVAGAVVQPVDFGNRKALHQPRIAHHLGAPAPFLCGLEDDRHGAVKRARFTQGLGGGEKHGHMPVMPTAMHPPRHGAGMGQARGLMHWQRIHIGAQADAAAWTVASMDQPHNAGHTDPLLDQITTKGAQLFGHNRSRAVAVEPQFGMGVEIAPPGSVVRQARGKTVADGHGVSWDECYP